MYTHFSVDTTTEKRICREKHLLLTKKHSTKRSTRNILGGNEIAVQREREALFHLFIFKDISPAFKGIIICEWWREGRTHHVFFFIFSSKREFRQHVEKVFFLLLIELERAAKSMESFVDCLMIQEHSKAIKGYSWDDDVVEDLVDILDKFLRCSWET